MSCAAIKERAFSLFGANFTVREAAVELGISVEKATHLLDEYAGERDRQPRRSAAVPPARINGRLRSYRRRGSK